MRKSWKVAAAVLFLLTLCVGSVVGGRLAALSDETRATLKTYTELVEAAKQNYAAEVKYEDLVYSSLGGMLRTLDPHTNFLPPQAFRSMRDKQASSFYGLGILVGQRNGRLTVITPIEGTPASRLGIRAGDVIDTIDGSPTTEMTMDEAIDHLKGPKGTKVNITIRRRGLDEPLPMEVTRAEIPQTTVRHAYMITPDTGYLWITDFARSTGAEVAQAVESLKKQGMKRLLLDLRNNGGGLLDQAIDVADQFVPEGALIVETRGRTRDSFAELKDSGAYEALDMPIVVLVNRGTASASEIVSGAIQDHDMGLIVGTPTWGKGLVQTVYNLPYGAGMALTTARYYTPTGRLIQRDYSDYFDYYTNLPEGEQVPSHSPDDPVYYTHLGRKVFGGGGITPDVIVDVEELPEFSQKLLGQNAPFDFAVDFSQKHKVASRAWVPDDTVVAEFKDWLIQEKQITPDEAAIEFAKPENLADIRLRIRSEVFNANWGQDASHLVRTAGDNQIQRALQLFGDAATLLAQRKEKDQGERRGA